MLDLDNIIKLLLYETNKKYFFKSREKKTFKFQYGFQIYSPGVYLAKSSIMSP